MNNWIDSFTKWDNKAIMCVNNQIKTPVKKVIHSKQ